MNPVKKYDLLYGIGMVLGFGGILFIPLLILPMLDNIYLQLISIAVWLLATLMIFVWRFKVAKNSEEVQSIVRKEKAEYFKRLVKRYGSEEAALRHMRKGAYMNDVDFRTNEEMKASMLGIEPDLEKVKEQKEDMYF